MVLSLLTALAAVVAAPAYGIALVAAAAIPPLNNISEISAIGWAAILCKNVGSTGSQSLVLELKTVKVPSGFILASLSLKPSFVVTFCAARFLASIISVSLLPIKASALYALYCLASSALTSSSGVCPTTAISSLVPRFVSTSFNTPLKLFNCSID